MHISRSRTGVLLDRIELRVETKRVQQHSNQDFGYEPISGKDGEAPKPKSRICAWHASLPSWVLGFPKASRFIQSDNERHPEQFF